MIILVSLISASAAFLFGFIWGTVYVPPVKAVKNESLKQTDPELERLKKEYENFLNYDGTMQP